MSKVVFLDCGSHKGQSIIYARQKFGAGIKVYSFDAMNFFTEHLTEIYKDDDNVSIINKAVWVEDCELEFHVSKTKASWGTSIHDRFSEDDTIKVTSDAVDFSKWIRDNLDINDTNILKLDIEGAEIEVLNKLMDEDTLSYFNLLLGEWHDQKEEMNLFESTRLVKNRLKQEYDTELITWEAPWFDESLNEMVTFGEYNSSELWSKFNKQK